MTQRQAANREFGTGATGHGDRSVHPRADSVSSPKSRRSTTNRCVFPHGSAVGRVHGSAVHDELR